MSLIFLNFVDNPVMRNCLDEIIGLASIDVPPNDPLEQYLLDHENDIFMNERREIDEVFFKQEPILKNNLPVEILGDPPCNAQIILLQ